MWWRPSRRPVGPVGLLVLVLVVGLEGCTLSDVPVLVAGYDANGTLVVGATDCSVGGDQADEVRLVHTSEVSGRAEIWAIDDGSSARPTSPAPPAPPPPPPPPPSPLELDEVRLVAVGEPDPPGWDVSTPLRAPVPEGGRLVVEVDQDRVDDSPTTLELPPGRGPDRFAAVVGDERFAAVGRVELEAAIRDTCDEATRFDGGLFAGIAGGATAVVLAGGVVAVLVAVRQFRRAGAANAARRTGQGLPGGA